MGEKGLSLSSKINTNPTRIAYPRQPRTVDHDGDTSCRRRQGKRQGEAERRQIKAERRQGDRRRQRHSWGQR